MLSNLGGWHFLAILVIVLLLFGATKLPALARSLGQSMKIFKNEMKGDDTGDRTGEHVVATDARKTDGPNDTTTTKP